MNEKELKIRRGVLSGSSHGKIREYIDKFGRNSRYGYIRTYGIVVRDRDSSVTHTHRYLFSLGM